MLGTITLLQCLHSLLFAQATSLPLSLQEQFQRELMPKFPADVRTLLEARGLSIEHSADLNVDGKFSVEGEQLRIQIRPGIFGENLKALLAHEGFHAAHYLLHSNEESWVREGLAQIFEGQVMGQLNPVNTLAGLKQISTSLFQASDGVSVDAAVYGHQALFFDYLLRRCSTIKLWDLARGKSGIYGTEHLQNLLESSGCPDFATLFIDFETARTLNRHLNSADIPMRYFLVSTTLRPELSDKLCRTSGCPSLFSAEAEELKSIPRSFTRVWIHPQFPYTVQNTLPDNISAWQLLLLPSL